MRESEPGPMLQLLTSLKLQEIDDSTVYGLAADEIKQVREEESERARERESERARERESDKSNRSPRLLICLLI